MCWKVEILFVVLSVVVTVLLIKWDPNNDDMLRAITNLPPRLHTHTQHTHRNKQDSIMKFPILYCMFEKKKKFEYLFPAAVFIPFHKVFELYDDGVKPTPDTLLRVCC